MWLRLEKRLNSVIPLGVGLGLAYAAMFIGTGIALPYMPLWLKGRGLSGSEIAVVLAAPMLMRLVAGPVFGHWAEGYQRFRTPIALLACAALTGAIGLSGIGFVPDHNLRWIGLILMWMISSVCHASTSPLTDAMAVQMGRRHDLNYAGPRAFGSAAFIAANLGIGWLIMRAPVDWVVWGLILSLSVLCLIGFFGLSPERRHEPQGGQDRDETPPLSVAVTGLIRHPGFVPVALIIGFMQSGHAFYYGFSTLIWKAHGVSTLTCGFLWATGVAAEIVFMMAGHRVRRRFGPWTMVMIGGGLGVVRWGLMALDPPLIWLWPLQGLHAASFAATYLAGLELVARFSPKGLETLAQSTSAAFATGAVTGLATLASGPIYDHFGVHGYGFMAVLAGLGLGLAVFVHRSPPQGRGGGT